MVSQENSEEESLFKTIVPEPAWNTLLDDLEGRRGKEILTGSYLEI
jgi:hypothetical protein